MLIPFFDLYIQVLTQLIIKPKNMKKTRLIPILLALILIMGNKAYEQAPTTSDDCPCKSNTIMTPEQRQQRINDYVPQIGKSNLQMPEGFGAPGSSRSMLDSKGTDFWLLFLRNYDAAGSIYIDITSEVNASGTVSVSGISFSQNFSVAANTVTRITVPIGAMILNSNIIQSLGIHVVSDNEVGVYGMSREQFTTDGFLGLPVDILGNQYLVMTYPGLGSVGTSPEFAIVSPYDNNLITITPRDLTYDGNPAGVPFNITLNQGETYLVRGQISSAYSADQTGSIISSALPVAVFSGTECANVPQGFYACDHICEQIPPLSTWGNTFVTRPLQGRFNGDTWRFLSSQNGTQLTIDGVNVATLNFGDFYETILTTNSYVVASNPILAVQFSNGEDWDGVVADPFMMVIPPYQQFLESYNFSTPASGFVTNYFNSAVETSGVSGMKLDGSPLNAAAYTAIGASGYSAAAFAVNINTSYNITNSGGYPSGLYLYGFDSYDSYGYPGGLSLLAINAGSGPVISLTTASLDYFCTSLSSNISLDVSASIVDNVDPFVQSAILFYRTIGAVSYTSLAMTDGGGDIWSATIPPADVNYPGIEYYIYATDGQVSTTSPGTDPANNPYVIGVDNQPPNIVHTPVTSSGIGIDILISADVTDNTDNVQSVNLYYRISGGTPNYTEMTMNLTGGNTYEATIPGAEMTSQGIDYYIKATDNHNVSCTYGTSDDPELITPGGNSPVPISNWPIYLGILLAVSFIIIRYRKMA